MAMSVNAGARLDRLPISSFHYRIFALVGAGMFFDGYDLYVAGGVLAATIQTKFSTLPQKPSSAKKTGNRDIAAMRSGRTSRAARANSRKGALMPPASPRHWRESRGHCGFE